MSDPQSPDGPAQQPHKGLWFRMEVGVDANTVEQLVALAGRVVEILDRIRPWLPILVPLLLWLTQLIMVVGGQQIS